MYLHKTWPPAGYREAGQASIYRLSLAKIKLGFMKAGRAELLMNTG